MAGVSILVRDRLRYPDIHFCTLFHVGNIWVQDSSLDCSAQHFLVTLFRLFLADTQFAFGEYMAAVVPAMLIYFG